MCRELTKMFEETNKNTLTALAAHYTKHPPKGEIVIVIAGKDPRAALLPEPDAQIEEGEEGDEVE